MASCQAAVSSAEFSEWIAFWLLETELSGGAEVEPSRDELGEKIHAWAAMHNANRAAKAMT